MAGRDEQTVWRHYIERVAAGSAGMDDAFQALLNSSEFLIQK